MSTTVGPVLLGGYAAKQCPVRTQNDHLPIAARWEPSPEDQARLDAGIAFELYGRSHWSVTLRDEVWLLPTLGGQTSLNLAVELAQSGVLDTYGVELIGANLQTILDNLTAGVIVGLARMASGAHWFSDVVWAGTFVYFISYGVASGCGLLKDQTESTV